MSDRRALSRRSFLRVVGGVGASFMIGSFSAIACAGPALDGALKAGARDATPGAVAFEPNVFVKLEPDDVVSIIVSRSEMGQGVRTSLAMLVAEEMDLDWTKVKIVQAEANPSVYGRQGTGGSSSIRSMYQKLRRMGATARIMIIEAAAKEWGVDASRLKTENGRVTDPVTGKSLAYGELTAQSAAQPVPASVKLKDPSEFRLIGKPTRRIDNQAVVTGTAIYGIDAKTDGMVYAVIARPPAFGGSARSFDDKAARAVPGVLDVIKIGTGVAVLGKHTWAAISGRDALKVDWDLGPHGDLDSAQIHDQMVAAVGPHYEMPTGAKTLEATFDLPYLAHATMEPMNCVADVKPDKATIWAATQVPDRAQQVVSQRLGIPAASVTVNVTLLGGGFGRRLQTDFIEEAVDLSKQTKQPVKLLWTREDDMRHDFYRPACHHSLKAVLDEQGNPVGWSHQAMQADGDSNATYGGSGLAYQIPKSGLRFGGASAPVPTGPWRSVENTLLNVVNECFIDELAHAAGQDPLAFRLKFLKDDRLKNVIQLAAAKAGWGQPLPAGSGRGIACFGGYGSYVAHVVELSVRGSKIKLHSVVAVVDCGTAVNPQGVEAITQGGITDGLSTALRAQITIEKGGVKEGSWNNYRWMTMDAMPVVEVHLVPSQADPGGMGEPPYPSVSPAVANAVFAATGKRVRKFPIKIEELA